MARRDKTNFRVGTDTYVMDRYAAAGGTGKRPVVVFLHGTDGLDGESGTEIAKFADEIAGQGYVVFVPHYFGSNGAAAGLPLAEVFMRRVQAVDSYAPRIASAVQTALTEPNVDSSRLGLIGLSLGGGLALQYAVSTPPGKVNAVVDFFGYIDAGSNVLRAAAKLPPTRIFHNKKDKIVNPQYSESLRDALKAHGVVHEYHSYDDDYGERYYHPFRPGGAADNDSRARTADWLKKYVGFAAATAS